MQTAVRAMRFDIEGKIANDARGYATVFAICSVFAMFLSSTWLSSPSTRALAGGLFTFVYLMINSVFLGRIFFYDETRGFRVAFGFLVLTMFMALGGACIIIASGFFPIQFDLRAIAFVLAVITIGTSISNHLQIRRTAKSKTETKANSEQGES